MSYKNLKDFELNTGPYDKIELKMYNPKYNFNNFAYPMPRTNYDLELQGEWCPHCMKQYEFFNNKNNFKEYFMHEFKNLKN